MTSDDDGQDLPRASKQRQRQRQLAEAVSSAGTVRIEELAERLGVSVMTVHRDLDELERQGLVRRTRGQATALPSSLFESTTTYRIAQNQPEKRALAEAAFDFVERGQALILDDSTTGLSLARLLPQKAPLTVLTNFLSLARELTEEPNISLSVLGGQYHAWCDAMMGRMTLDAIKSVRVDLFVMSSSAVTDDICFHHNEATVQVKQAMFEAAMTRIVYIDHTKFERRALHAMAPLTDFDAVIVDSLTPEVHVKRLRRQGARVIVAHPRSRSAHAARTAAEEDGPPLEIPARRGRRSGDG